MKYIVIGRNLALFSLNIHFTMEPRHTSPCLQSFCIRTMRTLMLYLFSVILWLRMWLTFGGPSDSKWVHLSKSRIIYAALEIQCIIYSLAHFSYFLFLFSFFLNPNPTYISSFNSIIHHAVEV